MPKRVPVLPVLPSALIRLAVNDLKWVRENPQKFFVDMDEWYVPGQYAGDASQHDEKPRCAVCFAGSVMAHTMGNGSEARDYDSYGPINRGRFVALNDFRQGCLSDALYELGLSVDRMQIDLDQIKARVAPTGWIDYEDDPRKFLAQMGRLAREFERVGL